MLLGFFAFASGIVDNIPYVATMSPLVVGMAQELWPTYPGTEFLHHPELIPVSGALSLGAYLGGNATLIGASANVVIAGIAEKAGHPIRFVRFLGYGFAENVGHFVGLAHEQAPGAAELGVDVAVGWYAVVLQERIRLSTPPSGRAGS
jgi:hypothetical protein